VTIAWATIFLITLATIVIKSTGPVLLGGRELPGWLGRVIALLAPALLAALVVADLFGKDQRLSVDERAVGIAAAGLALAAKLPMIAVVVVAAAVTAGLRAVI
jgi:branched-subunit amino acid transport protein